jgi:hypothetical protein
VRCAGSDQFRTVRFTARPNSGLSDLGRPVRPDYRLAGHTSTLDEHSQILNDQTQALSEHGKMLREILDRLS